MRTTGSREKFSRRQDGFTLAEIVMSVAIMTLVFSGIITAYIQNGYRAEWAGFSLAAQASACQQLERAKCAVWDINQNPVMDEIGGLTNTYVNTMDLPISGTNLVYVTNTCTITLITLFTNPVTQVYMVKVNATWPFRWGSTINTYTNTVADYFAPD